MGNDWHSSPSKSASISPKNQHSINSIISWVEVIVGDILPQLEGKLFAL
jgi:hypothetical protein